MMATHSNDAAASGWTFPADVVGRGLADARLLISQRGPMPKAFSGISDDSRTVQPGALFIAVRGSAQDGHDYLAAAERAGRPPRWSRTVIVWDCPCLSYGRVGRLRLS